MKLVVYFDIWLEDYKADGNLESVEKEINNAIKINFKDPRILKLYGWEKINNESAVCRCTVTVPYDKSKRYITTPHDQEIPNGRKACCATCRSATDIDASDEMKSPSHARCSKGYFDGNGCFNNNGANVDFSKMLCDEHEFREEK